jgi:hypothetical protein
VQVSYAVFQAAEEAAAAGSKGRKRNADGNAVKSGRPCFFGGGGEARMYVCVLQGRRCFIMPCVVLYARLLGAQLTETQPSQIMLTLCCVQTIYMACHGMSYDATPTPAPPSLAGHVSSIVVSLSVQLACHTA